MVVDSKEPTSAHAVVIPNTKEEPDAQLLKQFATNVVRKATMESFVSERKQNQASVKQA